MPSKQINLSGKAKFIRLVQPDKYGKWSLLLYLDKPSLNTWAELKEGGILNTLKMDQDGQYVRLARPLSKEFRGVKTQMTPPIVIDKDGNSWPQGIAIGNGSDVTAHLSFYTYTKQSTYGGSGQGAAIRLEGIKVNNLVPYQPAVSGDEDEQKQLGDLHKQPVPWEPWPPQKG